MWHYGNCNLLTSHVIQYNMGDREMLDRLFEQLKITDDNIDQVEDEKEVLRERIKQIHEALQEQINQVIGETIAAEIGIKEYDSKIEQLEEDAKRIRRDIASIQGI